MIRTSFVITAFLLVHLLPGQISITSVDIIKSDSLDSFYLSLQLPDLDLKKVELVSLNDGENTQVYSFYFSGCPLSQLITYFDTTMEISAPPPYRLVIYTVYDTTKHCSFPSSPLVTDSVMLSSAAIGSIENRIAPRLFSLSPNPADDLIRLQFKANTDITQIELLDVQGKVLNTYAPDTRLLKTHDLPKGTYFIKVHGKKGHLIRKVIVQ